MAAEFDLIARYFVDAGARRSDVTAGIGDDAALVTPPAGNAVVSVCTALHEGFDFPPGSPAADLGRRTVDGALRALAERLVPDEALPHPAWAMLGLTLPAADEDWTREFAGGFGAACRSAGIELVGGDTTRGPRTIVCVLHALLSPSE